MGNIIYWSTYSLPVYYKYKYICTYVLTPTHSIAIAQEKFDSDFATSFIKYKKKKIQLEIVWFGLRDSVL